MDREMTLGASSAKSSVWSNSRLKREEVGLFDPECDDSQDVGMVIVGKDLIFTDVWTFIGRLEFFKDGENDLDIEAEIKRLFPTLLQGSAVHWWTTEITNTKRRELQRAEYGQVIDTLASRFSMEPTRATRKFRKGFLQLKDIAKDEFALRKFIQRNLQYARAMGTIDRKNLNWRGAINNI